MINRAGRWRDFLLAEVTALKLRFLPEGSLRHRFAKNVSWTMAGYAATSLSGLIVAAVVARMVGQQHYGELGIIISTYSLFSQLGSFGLGVAVLKCVAEFRSTDPAKAGRIAGLAMQIAMLSYGITSLAVIWFSPELARILKAPHLEDSLRISGLMLFVLGLDSVQAGVLSGLEVFAATARISLLRAVFNLPASVLGAWLGGVDGVVWAMLATTLVIFAANRWLLGRECGRQGVTVSYRAEPGEFNALVRVSIPNFLGGCLTLPVTWLVNTMLVRQPNGYAAMGILNAASQWRSLAVMIPNVFNSAFIALQSNLYGLKAHQDYKRSIVMNLKVQTAAAVAVMLFLLAGSPWIMGIYGAGFRQGSGVLALLALSWGFIAPNWILWNSLLAAGQAWRGFLFNLLGSVLLVGLAWLFLDRGPLGVALAYLISSAVQTSLQFAYFINWQRTALR